MKLTGAFALVGIVVTVVGCASSGNDDVSQGGNALSSTAAAGHDACVQQATAGNVTSVKLNTSAKSFLVEQGLEGVNVCAQISDGSQPQSCAKTAADGTVTLSLAPCQDVRLTYALDGNLGSNQLVRVGAADLQLAAHMLAADQAQQVALLLGTTVDPSKALPVIATLDASGAPLAGVTVGGSLGDGKNQWYLAGGLPQTTATATDASGVSGFTNVDTGMKEVVATAPGKTCVPVAAVPGEAPNSAAIEAIAGSLAQAAFICN